MKKIISFSPRQFKNETKTASFLMHYLKQKDIDYKLHYFYVNLPYIKKAELLCDGRKVECSGCSMQGGKIKGKDVILSSLLPSSFYQHTANINFNPKCKGAISNANYYFAPALAVSHKSLNKVINAEKVGGSVSVKKVKHRAVNILVGNLKNPKSIIFAHYDSIKTGAIDNASGVSAVMGAVLENPDTTKDNLMVFSANEELSYDHPTYWGHGFRVFEAKYSTLIKKAKKIIVVDCVGNGKNQIVLDPSLVKLGFPIKNLNRYLNKIKFIVGDFDKLMQVYHSEIDDGRQLTEKSLKQAKEILIKQLGIKKQR